MNDLGLNKVMAAVLATALGVMAVRELPHLLLHSDYPEKPVYTVGSLDTATDTGPVEAVPFPSPDFIAAMDVERGLKVFKKCTSCHNADNGGAHSTGPNLYGIMGAAAGAKADFKYSSAMAGSGLTWDYETLDGFLAKPSKYLKGTNMSYIGLKKEADRAALMAYLRQQSETQIPLPVAAAIDAPEGGAEMVEEMSEAGSETAETVIEQVDGVIEEQSTEAKQMIEDVTDKAEGVLDKAEEIVEETEDAPQ